MLSLLVNGPSNSAKVLAGELGVKRVKWERLDRLKARTIINWGVRAPGFPAKHRVINRNTMASNKLEAFALIKKANLEDILPPFTDNLEQAKGWTKTDIVLARFTLDGSGGEGIKVIRPGEEVPAGAKLYVKYIKKTAEYRVHVVNGTAIFVQQKRKKNGVEQNKDQALIRNHGNGWVFAENDLTFVEGAGRETLEQVAMLAVKACGLDFGAVDLIVGNDGNVYFLEVNCRPGIESTRLREAYAAAFRAYERG